MKIFGITKEDYYDLSKRQCDENCKDSCYSQLKSSNHSIYLLVSCKYCKWPVTTGSTILL